MYEWRAPGMNGHVVSAALSRLGNRGHYHAVESTGIALNKEPEEPHSYAFWSLFSAHAPLLHFFSFAPRRP